MFYKISYTRINSPDVETIPMRLTKEQLDFLKQQFPIRTESNLVREVTKQYLKDNVEGETVFLSVEKL